jgi:hypothetical protein
LNKPRAAPQIELSRMKAKMPEFGFPLLSLIRDLRIFAF